LIKSRSVISILIFFLFICTIIGLIWGIFRLEERNPFGSGFSIQWNSIRYLVTDDISPYSEINTEKLQGRLTKQFLYVQWGSPKYTSPLFSGIVVFPFALIGNENLAHSFWSSLQLLAFFGVIVLGLRVTGWKTSWNILFFFLIFSLFSYHVLAAWLDGGLSIWSALFLVLAVFMLQNGRNEASGVFLALALIQPIMVILPVVFVLIWSAAHKRRILIFWFFITIILLSTISLFLVSDWIIQYIRLLYNFSKNFPPGSPDVLFSTLWPGLGKQFGWILSGICAALLIVEWWLALRKDFRWFLWTVCFTIVISQWIGIPTVPVNLFGMIFALILISAMLSERWSRGGQWAAVFLAVILFIWEWTLFYRNTFISNPGMQNNLIIPLPLVLLIGLYWVRWWAVKPRGLLLDGLKFGETA
jgi:hypothetical protein